LIRYDWGILRSHPIPLIFNILYRLDNIDLLQYSDKRLLKIISRFKDKSSFLIDPMNLISNRSKHTDSELYYYLELAAYRSYFEYKETGRLSLPTYYIEDRFDLRKLRLNSTLSVTNEEILFKYEEN